MNKQDVVDWKASPVTQQAFKEIDAVVQELQSQPLHDPNYTMDDVARMAIYREAFSDGVKALKVWLDDAEFNAEDENID